MSGFVRKAETDIAAPAAQVFDYLSDVTRHPEWADQDMTVEHVAGPSRGPGATFKTHVEIDMPVGHGHDDATVVVQQAVASRYLAYEATDGSGHYRWTIDLTENAGATHVTQTVERLEGPLWIRLTQPLIWRAMGRKMVTHGLEQMKERLEHPNSN